MCERCGRGRARTTHKHAYANNVGTESPRSVAVVTHKGIPDTATHDIVASVAAPPASARERVACARCAPSNCTHARTYRHIEFTAAHASADECNAQQHNGRVTFDCTEHRQTRTQQHFYGTRIYRVVFVRFSRRITLRSVWTENWCRCVSVDDADTMYAYEYATTLMCTRPTKTRVWSVVPSRLLEIREQNASNSPIRLHVWQVNGPYVIGCCCWLSRRRYLHRVIGFHWSVHHMCVSSTSATRPQPLHITVYTFYIDYNRRTG